MVERERGRSLSWQLQVKANLFGTEGYEDYAAACLEANPGKPMKTPRVQKSRRQLEAWQEMEEKTLNHGMFALILACLLSDIFLEV